MPEYQSTPNIEQFNPKELDYHLAKLKKNQEKEKQSVFELPGYSDNENIWQKIMEIDIGNGKPKTK